MQLARTVSSDPIYMYQSLLSTTRKVVRLAPVSGHHVTILPIELRVMPAAASVHVTNFARDQPGLADSIVYEFVTTTHIAHGLLHD